jgi:hypothetical protein
VVKTAKQRAAFSLFKSAMSALPLALMPAQIPDAVKPLGEQTPPFSSTVYIVSPKKKLSLRFGARNAR